MSETWQRGFVLHRSPYNESSLLVSLFTECHGRLSVLAKGARSKRSHLKSLLQPFTPLLLRFSGKGDLKLLTKAEAAALALPLENTALFSGFYVNELLSRVIEPNTAYPQLFEDYLTCLTALCQAGDQVEPHLRCFEFKLLNALGYGVDFTHCVGSGKPIDPDMFYQYQPEKGFIASLLDNQMRFKGEALLHFAQLNFDSVETRQAAKRFTRMVLKPYLGAQPLKSRELFLAQNLHAKSS
ncbi:DNA repair protein RecO [Pasteurellaceae bacterium HPA106]|uniref:DNA repair protein RecO n=1 Tax=Spirabiliibacterium pneumoniae TaxID=221400 RepID=UPI001AAC56C3|nr:DNA repair protein RecO [Spirabiliibacterium pneumoniae]MBE2896096.1 DNA repair protein RecO [Spirabiliibacterium pneumoniae]